MLIFYKLIQANIKYILNIYIYIQGDSELTRQRWNFLNPLNSVYFFIKISIYDQNKWKIM